MGDFLIHSMDWTGMSAGDLLQAMRGGSPVSAGAVEELTALRTALIASPDAQALVTSGGSDADILAALQARPDAVGAAARAYVDVVGLRILGGYDVADRHAREHPELIMKVIRASMRGEDATRRAAATQAIARIRERVPAQHQAQFDALLAEAQSVYRVRDERVFHGDTMASGIVRRAILAAGERLVSQGRAKDAEDLVDATPDEIVALLEGRPGPSATELAERARWRRETPITAAPANLGFAPSPPPPPEWLPPAAAQLQRITALIMSLLFDVHKPATAPAQTQLKGFPVSPGVYEGPVRVIRDVEELPLVQHGEVLVASSTGSTFNVVLPLIGALVTERGGGPQPRRHRLARVRSSGHCRLCRSDGETEDRDARARRRGQGRSMDDRLVPLVDAVEESAFGGKAASLGAAIRAGLPVPPGVVLGTAMVDRVAAGDHAALAEILSSPHIPDARLAVRSSAVGEDSADASFAGQHATKLNVSKTAVHEAVRIVWASARTDAALAYRSRKALPAHPKIAAVVQLLVEPVAAGVLFTRNPLTGADERMIEASWGLGEAVVSGIVVPDRVRLSPQGRVLEFVVGDKDVKIGTTPAMAPRRHRWRRRCATCRAWLNRTLPR